VTPQERQQLAEQLGQVFTPAAPINEESLFAGRTNQVTEVVDAINTRGQHAIIFGERGVGKTSLANILSSRLSSTIPVIAPRVNCDGSDDYSSLWRKVFDQITIARKTRRAGFTATQETIVKRVAADLPAQLTPDHIRSYLALLANGVILVVIVDEFDRLATKALRNLMADTIKTLSDHAVNATLVIVGVADSVDELIEGHHSIERALVQVRMPRMSSEELKGVVQQGMTRLGLAIEADALEHVALLSQGLPHYTHLLALNATREAISDDERRISMQHIEHAIAKALKQAQQTTLSTYMKATASHRRDNLYTEVLLSCALAPTDELGYFAAADVREPLSTILKKPYDIPSYSRHLNDFCEPERGPILQKTGVERRFKFRFVNPLMQPFVTLQGFTRGLIDRPMLERFQAAKKWRATEPRLV
jgi:Cdc6-like AAA superfamily ATPase